MDIKKIEKELKKLSKGKGYVVADDLNKFFREKILRIENPNASVLASVVLKENSNFYTVAPPYLKTKNLKKIDLI